MKKLLIILVLLIFPGSPAWGKTVVDQAGRSVHVPERPARIVSLAPSITEIIYSIGAEDKLVGATQYSNYPAAAGKLPRVGSYVRLDIEKIVALKPDICFGIRDGNPKYLVEKIEALGIPVYVIDPRNIAGIMQAIQGIGAVLQVSEKAQTLVADLENRINRVLSKTGPDTNRPRVFFQVDAAPIITAGTNTFTHELIIMAGGVNLGAGPVPYPRYSWEDVLAMRPDIVVITSMAGGHRPEKLKNDWRRWPQLPAVRNHRIYVVDADLFDRPTARLVNGLEALAAIIHPDLFETTHD